MLSRLFSFFSRQNANSDREGNVAYTDLEAAIPLISLSTAADIPQNDLEMGYQLLTTVKKNIDREHARQLANGLSRQRLKNYSAITCSLLLKAALWLVGIGAFGAMGYLIIQAINSADQENESQNELLNLSRDINSTLTAWTNPPFDGNPFSYLFNTTANYTCGTSCSETPSLSVSKELIACGDRACGIQVNYIVTGCEENNFNCTTEALSSCSILWQQLCDDYKTYIVLSKLTAALSFDKVAWSVFSGVSGIVGICLMPRVIKATLSVPANIRAYFSNDSLHSGFVVPVRPKVDLRNLLSEKDYEFLVKIEQRFKFNCRDLQTYTDFIDTIKRVENIIRNESRHTFLSGGHKRNKGTSIYNFFAADTNGQLRKQIIEGVLGHPLKQEQERLFAVSMAAKNLK